MTLSLETLGSELRCVDQAGAVHWKVSIDDIILVAEYTTDEGPLFDDYYLIFCAIEAEHSVFATSTVYANRRDAALQH
jgi:hypothetical protein